MVLLAEHPLHVAVCHIAFSHAMQYMNVCTYMCVRSCVRACMSGVGVGVGV